jgi:hypothetical protein
LIYTFDGKNGYWAGTEKTSKASPGVYFYVVDVVFNAFPKYSGYIELIRE